jgi:predicted FMN-binding regulatory protein PaiB
MIFYPYYSDLPSDEIDRVVARQILGRLVTVGGDGTPHLGLYPFRREGSCIELHLHRSDEQIADLKARPKCIFEIDEVLANIPSYWVHPESGVAATAYHRTVIFEATAVVSDDPEVIAAQQQRLLGQHQPEGGYKHVALGDPLYQSAMQMISSVVLTVTACRPKFKLGQNRPIEVRQKVAAELRKRGQPGDLLAAEALEWTIAQEQSAGK